jgi:hypothetical protein
MVDRAELEAWLCEDEAASLPERVDRLCFVVEEGGPEIDRLFPGGPISAWAFLEARRAYIYGLDIACVIMTQVCLEHSLLGMFKWAGRDDLDGASFKVLLSEAKAQGFLSEGEYELFERLRRFRNPYAHPRSLDDESAIIKRAETSRTSIDVIPTDDARQAIAALLHLTRRPPFGAPSMGER